MSGGEMYEPTELVEELTDVVRALWLAGGGLYELADTNSSAAAEWRRVCKEKLEPLDSERQAAPTGGFRVLKGGAA